MIKPYEIQNSNLNLMLSNMMEKTFFFLLY